MFGKIIGLLLDANENADWKSIWFSYMRKAMTTDALLETPAWQCTKIPPLAIPSLMNTIAAGKWRIKLLCEVSFMFMTL
jgi:hypothetical protein